MLLHVLVFAPFLAALLMVAASHHDYRSASRLAVLFAAALTVGSVMLIAAGSVSTTPHEWFFIPGCNATVYYVLASHGFGAWLVFLSSIVGLAALIAARSALEAHYRNFAVGVFALMGALNGTFLAGDAVLFFFFFEAMVVPAAVLIGAYGGSDRKSAALNFAIYTLAGSAPMAIALWYILAKAGSSNPFAIMLTIQMLPAHTQNILFWCFALAFWVKTPLFPFHGWQAQTYAEAPAPLSAILTGVMSKAGVFGFLYWVIPLFPMDDVANKMMWLGLLTAVYGSLMALRATDAKKLLAFSSMGHLGLAVAGLFALSASTLPAVLVLLVGHGLSASAQFLLTGVAERFAGSRKLADMGGLARRNPVFGFFFGFSGIAAIAIPGTVGFIGEFLVLLSLWSVGGLPAIVAGFCIILSAAYMLRFIQAVLFGKAKGSLAKAPVQRFLIGDGLAVVPLLILLLVFGFHPAPIANSVSMPTAEENSTDGGYDESWENAPDVAGDSTAADAVLEDSLVTGTDSVSAAQEVPENAR